MDEIVREPCPRCGEPAALAGRACPHCGHSLLVDLTGGGINDERPRYRAARDLSRMGPPFPPLLRLQELLARPNETLASGVTRQAGRAALEILTASGGRGRMTFRDEHATAGLVPEFEEAFRSRGWKERMVFVIPALAAVALLFLVFRAPSSPAVRTGPAPRPTASVPRTRPTPSLSDLASASLESTAALRCDRSRGAGFFVAPDLLVTNEHVLCANGAAPEVELQDGRRLPGRVEARDDWLDVALVRVPGAAVRPLALGDATAIAPGETVLMIGSPLGMEFSVTRAIVSHPARGLFGIVYLQVDANINPGNSGGPLVDAHGRAVAIASMMVAHSQGLGLALPVNYLYELPGVQLPMMSPPPDFGRWRAYRARAREDEERQAGEVRVAFAKPGLAGASIGPTGAVFAIIVARGRPAGAVPFTFEIVREGRAVCTATAIVEDWDFYQKAAPPAAQDSRYLRWLKRAGLADDVFVGTAPLRMEGCPSAASVLGDELVIPGADSLSGRAVIGMYRDAR